MTWLASNWHLIVGGIAALAGGGVLAWPYLPSVVGKAKSDKPDYRRGLDALEVFIEEAVKAGASDKDIAAWRKDAAMQLLGITK